MCMYVMWWFIVYKFTVNCCQLQVTSLHYVNIVYSKLLLTDYTLHSSVAFVFFFCPIRSFLTCAITKIIARLSMGVNVLTLNKYMIMADMGAVL